MKTLRFQQIAVVNAPTAEEFEVLFNDTMENLSDCDPTFEFNHSMGFCAYITYTKRESFKDCMADYFHEKGIYYKCWQCPYCHLSSDKRVKKLTCDRSPSGITHKNSECCDIFYNELATNEITPREVIA